MQQSLHYVWINSIRAPIPAFKEMAYCPIPEHYADNIADVRENHPDIDITIWADFYGAVHCPRDKWEAAIEEAMLPGVNFRMLRTMPEYREEPLFGVSGDSTDYMYGAIWQQVDLARLFVLATVLEEQGQGNAFYNDMDLTDPRVDDPKGQEILTEHGMAFLHYPSLSRGKGYMENSLMAFNHSRLPWIREVLIPRTKDFLAEHETGWEALKAVLAEEYPDADPELMEHLVIKSDHLAIAHPGHEDFQKRNKPRTKRFDAM